jgi:hypothetical protein
MRVEFENGYYEGEVDANGEPSGHGSVFIDGNLRYEGEWKDGHHYGYGKSFYRGI